MYGKFQQFVAEELEGIREAGFYKEERVITTPQGSHVHVETGEDVINLCANNYLGLAQDERVKRAAMEGLERWGYGMASVRFICGTQTIHRQLEERIAGFFGTEDTILYGSCWNANEGLFQTIAQEQDAIISDELNHASIIDGVRLSKAKKERFKNRGVSACAVCDGALPVFRNQPQAQHEQAKGRLREKVLMQPGDLLFYATDPSDPATIHHVMLYMGDGQMVEAPYSGESVRVRPVPWGYSELVPLATEAQTIDSPDGPIEFAEAGDGPAVLLIHGAGGGFDQGLDLGDTFLGDGYRVEVRIIVWSVINRHYILDLAKDRSFIEYAVGQGLQELRQAGVLRRRRLRHRRAASPAAAPEAHVRSVVTGRSGRPCRQRRAGSRRCTGPAGGKSASRGR